MKRSTIPIEQLFAWGKLNGVEFNNVDVKTDVSSHDGAFKGGGLVSTSDRTANEDGAILMVVPQDLILSREQVERYAAIDKHLKSVLDAAGAFGRVSTLSLNVLVLQQSTPGCAYINIHLLTFAARQTARGAILIFLLVQITNASTDFPGPISVTNPHTDYAKLLPESVLLPTYYTDEEKCLLLGTSLQHALDQKLRSLENEFDQLHEYTQSTPWCQEYWWDEGNGKLTFEDWMLVDALYRSRALDLPGAGHAMVPCVDMANHASGVETIALYETDEDGRAVLQMRSGKKLVMGEEVTITYGDGKGACEMMFSYGFLEPTMGSAKVIFLDLDIPDDDPLRMVKKSVNKEAPGVRLFVDNNGSFKWESEYIWWTCVNEEDGLGFRVAQQTDGNRQLEVLWKDQQIDPSQLSKALKDDLKWDVFRLRAVVMLQERVSLQASDLEVGDELFSESQGQPGVREMVRALIGRLRTLEGLLLSVFHRVFEEQVRYIYIQDLTISLTSLQKTDLLGSDTVKKYLEAAQMDADPGLPAQTSDEDFS
jgi:hypothetical protein